MLHPLRMKQEKDLVLLMNASEFFDLLSLISPLARLLSPAECSKDKIDSFMLQIQLL
jgi:hypothetical protein